MTATRDGIGTPSWRPRPAHGVVVVVVDGDVVVSGPDRPATVHQGTASLIWQFADGSCSVRELALDLGTVLAGDPEELLAEVLSFCTRMAELGWMAGGSPVVETATDAPPSEPTGVGEQPARNWSEPLDLVAGGVAHRVLVNDESLRRRLDRTFQSVRSTFRADDIDRVARISTSTRPGRGPRFLPTLFLDGRTQLVSRDLGRIVRFLNGWLDHSSSADEVQLRDYLAVVKSSRAILVPATVLSPSTLTESALAAAGASILEQSELRVRLGDATIRRAGALSPAELAEAWDARPGLGDDAGPARLSAIVAPAETPVAPARLVAQLLNQTVRSETWTSQLSAVAELGTGLQQITPGSTIASLRSAILGQLQ